MPYGQVDQYRWPAWHLTGKTSKLLEWFLAAVGRYGPERVAAITFTRSAAEELRQRAGAALGMGRHSDTLRAKLPYVGTIHSLAYRALGRPKVVDGRSLKEFADYVKLPPTSGVPEHPDDVDGYWTPDDVGNGNDPGLGKVLKTVSAARHRDIPVEQAAAELMSPRQLSLYSPAWFAAMAVEYRRWKAEMRLVDYDDMLEAGARLELPVAVLLDDEAQDQSILMWRIVDAWAEKTDLALFAGDKFQAIYHFSGADPTLFGNHRGVWTHLGTSYRLSDSAVGYSRRVLEAGGWDLGAHPTPDGAGGRGVGGTTLYMARTNTLVRDITDRLMLEGEPFLSLRGSSPWNTGTANAYRMIAALKEGNMISSTGLSLLARSAVVGFLPRGATSEADRLAKRDVQLSIDEVDKLLRVATFQYRYPEIAEYMERVERRYGVRGINSRPKTTVSTIHAAKGREADHVVLVSDWGFLPGRIAAGGGEGSRLEACVAYVAVTRHKVGLSFLSLGKTMEYTFPERCDDGE